MFPLLKNNFEYALGALTLLLGFVFHVIGKIVPTLNLGIDLWIGLLFYVLVTFLVYKLTGKSLLGRGTAFLKGLATGMSTRLFMTAAFIIIFYVVKGGLSWYFVGVLFVMYISFTLFEVLWQIKTLKNNTSAKPKTFSEEEDE